MCSDPRALGVAEDLFEVWSAVKEILGPRFASRMRAPKAVIIACQKRGEASGHLDAALHIIKSLENEQTMEEHEGWKMALTAAAVDLIVEGVEVRANG